MKGKTNAKGHKVSEETRAKISNSKKGVTGWKWTMEQKQAMSERMKGNLNGLGTLRDDKFKEAQSKRMMGNKVNIGRVLSSETRAKIGAANAVALKGRIMPEEVCVKLRGSNSPNWKGGTSDEYRIIRSSREWKWWKNKVFTRDKFTCQNPNCKYCHNEVGVALHPHHLKQFKTNPELVFDADNGVTYCADYHMKGGLHK